MNGNGSIISNPTGGSVRIIVLLFIIIAIAVVLLVGIVTAKDSVSRDRIMQCLIYIVPPLIGGGTVTYGALKFELPGFGRLKDTIITDKDVLNRLSRYHSYHVVTLVMAHKIGGRIADAQVRGTSTKTNEFYGLEHESTVLIGKRPADLFGILLQWMDPKDYQDFVADQQRVITDYENGRDAYALVPIKFNDKHPIEQYRNRMFLPLIVGLTGTRKVGEDREEELMTVLYLNASKIPKDLFKESAT